jgi:NAD kinase
MKPFAAPKRVIITGRPAPALRKLLKERGVEVVRAKPDMVISFGGDGTILFSEKKFPGVPKLCVRASKGCAKCTISRVERFELPEHEKVFYCLNCIAAALDRIVGGTAVIREEPKLLGKVFYTRNGRQRTQEAIALNEVQVHNKRPTHALRCRVKVGDETVAPVFMGDGVIVATPFGASGYFNAVTRHVFKKGFGIAFNNGIYHRAPLFLDDLKKRVTIEVIRRQGLFIADNFESTVVMLEGDFVTVEQADEPARFVVT